MLYIILKILYGSALVATSFLIENVAIDYNEVVPELCDDDCDYDKWYNRLTYKHAVIATYVMLAVAFFIVRR